MIIEVFAERRRFGVDARGGLRRDSKPEHLFELDADGELHVLSGLVPRLAAAARRAGYPVELQDLAEPTVPASAPDGADLDDDGQRLAAILARCRRAVLQVRSPGDRLAAIELALRLFPTGRFMIVTMTRSEARKIARILQAGREEPVACYTRQLTTSDARIQVGTDGGLDLLGPGVVLFTDARHVLREGVRGRLLILRRQRGLGLLDERLVLSRRERLVIEGYAGPVIGRIGAPDDEPEDVRAVFADWTGGERPDEPLGLEWKRRSIWGNPERNEATARLATALADGDLGTLWAYGLFLDGELVLRPPADRRVAVLVESPEHAGILGRLLPGWAVLRADGTDVAAVGRAGAAGAGPDDRGDMPRRAIVTCLHADRRGRIEADVVIRADGLPWPLDLPVAAPRPGRAEGRLVLLVDLADHQDRTARDATRARRLDYQNRGWIAQ